MVGQSTNLHNQTVVDEDQERSMHRECQIAFCNHIIVVITSINQSQWMTNAYKLQLYCLVKICQHLSALVIKARSKAVVPFFIDKGALGCISLLALPWGATLYVQVAHFKSVLINSIH